MTTAVKDIQRMYFIGIGGIGMSALARYFHRSGVQVAGYDRDRSDLVEELMSEGMTVHFEDDPALIGNVDLVVYTPAIPDEHRQLSFVRAQDTPLYKRSEVLGMLSREQRCIAVAGTHGKTTTSTMIAYLLRASGVDCTAFLGGLAVDFDGNFVHGASDWMVAEADEYDRSFLRLSPEIAVVTSVDPDHLDIYGTPEEMYRGYVEFLQCVQPGGMVIIHEDAWNRLMPFAKEAQQAMQAQNIGGLIYGKDDGANVRLTKIASDGHEMLFDVQAHDTYCSGLRLAMPGEHNVMNAIGALTCGLVLQHVFEEPGMQWLEAGEKLSGFKGISRRFEFVHTSDNLVVIDDYAHHPKELEAVISATRTQFPDRKITGVFQPHLYSRTADFYKEFAAALSELDICILVELYPAREEPIPGVSSDMIHELVQVKEKYSVGKTALTETIERTDPEILLFMGAGDLDRMIPSIVESLTT